jgi:uncharacterized membrane protein YciS (DUF1049 family)
MKVIKILLLLIILGLLATLGYQNQDYFLTDTDLTLTLFSLHYTTLPLANWAYWGVCFGLGLLITGIRGLFTAFRLGREIKAKNAKLRDMNTQIDKLKSQLDVFTRDPYIKKATDKKAAQDEGTASKSSEGDASAEKADVN